MVQEIKGVLTRNLKAAITMLPVYMEISPKKFQQQPFSITHFKINFNLCTFEKAQNEYPFDIDISLTR